MRWRELRQTAGASVVVLLAGAVIEWINTVFVFPYWARLGLRAPVAEHLIRSGYGWLAGPWSLLWLHLPDYLLAFLVGTTFAVAVRSRPKFFAALCSGGVVLRSLGSYLYYIGTDRLTMPILFLIPVVPIAVLSVAVVALSIDRTRGS